MDRLFKNLRLMDVRIKDRKEHKLDGATIQVYSLHEAEELMRALVARNAYDAVDCSASWSKDTGYIFNVTTWWEA